MFGLSDIVALAKSGYSVSDVKELIALSKEPPQPETPPAEVPPENSESTGSEQNKPPEVQPEDNPKIKELEDKVKSLTAQLETAQKANINKDQSGSYKPVDPIAEFTKLFE